MRDDSGTEPIPSVGGTWIVVDGAGQPAAVIRSTNVRTGPLSSVTEQFAWDEGEGDREWWLRAHHDYFRREGTRRGFVFDPDIATVFERFEVRWPAVEQPGTDAPADDD